MDTAAPQRFQTSIVPSDARVQFWNDLAAETFGSILITPQRQDFSASMLRRQFDGLRIARVESTASRVAGMSGSPRGQGLYVLLNEGGTSRHRQCGREAVLQRGELTLLHSNDRYTIEFTDHNVMVVLYLPLARAAHIDIEPHIATPHSVEESALLASFMRRLIAYRDLDREIKPPAHLAQTAMDLMALCWPGETRSRPRVSMEVRAQDVCECVQRELENPALSAELIADSLGVTSRYVHLIFARMETTAAAYITGMRLDAAAARLRQQPKAHITDVALDCGFRDLSYFCRAFRRRFGTSARRFQHGLD